MAARGRRCWGSAGGAMDETVAEFIRRTVLKMPRPHIPALLQAWGFLPAARLQALDMRPLKETIADAVVQLCQEKPASMKEAGVLDIIYNHTFQNKRIWTVYQMTKAAGGETDIFDFSAFKRKFKRRIQSALINVTVNFKEFEDNAIWIRIAWGTSYTKPNQYKATYVVYHSQTPYAFISKSVNRSNLPLLCQALIVASNYGDIREMELRSHCLDSLKDIVFKRYSQTFQTHHPKPLQERNVAPENVDPRIIQEDKSEKERIQRVNQEVFGDGPQPKLEFAQYKLETMFKSNPKMVNVSERESFRCLVKFSSPHLLEALKSLAPAGMADVPLSPLLTCIPHKARNYFKIKEKKGLLAASLVSP